MRSRVDLQLLPVAESESGEKCASKWSKTPLVQTREFYHIVRGTSSKPARAKSIQIQLQKELFPKIHRVCRDLKVSLSVQRIVRTGSIIFISFCICVHVREAHTLDVLSLQWESIPESSLARCSTGHEKPLLSGRPRSLSPLMALLVMKISSSCGHCQLLF